MIWHRTLSDLHYIDDDYIESIIRGDVYKCMFNDLHEILKKFITLYIKKNCRYQCILYVNGAIPNIHCFRSMLKQRESFICPLLYFKQIYIYKEEV